MNTPHDQEQPRPASEDPAVVRAWRHASSEQPPARLDAAILEAARRAVEADDARATPRRAERPTRNRWMQWQPLAAAATVAGLAFVLLQTLPRERDVAPPIGIQVPEPAHPREATPAVPGEASPAPAVAPGLQGSAAAPAFTEVPAKIDAGSPLRERGTVGAAASPPAEVAADRADMMRSPGADLRKGLIQSQADRFHSQEAAAAADRTPDAATPRSAEDWAGRIEALLASGDVVGAAATLREFRATDPDADARLPESLRAWAQTVE